MEINEYVTNDNNKIFNKNNSTNKNNKDYFFYNNLKDKFPEVNFEFLREYFFNNNDNNRDNENKSKI
jgi:hypothetical protein